MINIRSILEKGDFSKEEIIQLLAAEGDDLELLYQKAAEVRLMNVGNKVYFRGLIEYSNICSKNCFYCGLRCENKAISRYALKDEEVVEAAKIAYERHFGSLVIQAGERSDSKFVQQVAALLKKIREISEGKLRVTLSLGEQNEETYQLWRENGAQRYLLRIETSNPELYRKLHQDDTHHRYEKRIESLAFLRKTGYQVGTGVMIGLPFQIMEDLANDLLFIKSHDIDMVGMGPYVKNENTPLYAFRHLLLPKEQRLELSIKMVAILRLMMPQINIAATTAMQTLHPKGREMALRAGANVVMPNLTPLKYRDGYLIYDNKPNNHEETGQSLQRLRKNIENAGCVLALGEWGDSQHFQERVLTEIRNEK
jgi:biotin synthase